MTTIELTEAETKRFWKSVTKSDGCWICSALPSGTYARIGFRGRLWLAHIISFILHKGAIPDGMKVCHSCDTPRCVRPDHLFAKTHSENMLEMVARNRHKVRFGLDNNLAKLPDEAIIDIKNHLVNKTKTIRQLADQYGVTYQCIWRIAVGLSRERLGPAGRIIAPKPVRHLTVSEVIEIRTRANRGERQCDIAADFGIWQATVSQIVHGVKRKDVPMQCQNS